MVSYRFSVLMPSGLAVPLLGVCLMQVRRAVSTRLCISVVLFEEQKLGTISQETG